MTNLNKKLFLEREKGICLNYLYDVVNYKDEFHFINDMIEAYKVLFKIVEPLLAEIDLIGSSKEDHDNKVRYLVENDSYRLEKAFIPEYVEPSYHLGHAIEEKTDKITPEKLEKWIRKCIDQPSSDPDEYEVSWENLFFSSTKAKLPDGFEPLQIEVSDEDNYMFKMDVEQEEDGKWLYGPIKESSVWPPIQIEFYRVNWLLSLDLKISNSIWFEKGSEGRKMVLDVVNELREIGWDLTYASSEFSPELEVKEDED